ncbi:uncharacterized protein SAPINGB_P004513 [Magnusiomyces paraingens]|uniref:Uncharacterized protein n=1 Tax=Magnusiomyces paraingens TaxID=2606893 RepID=A0A5E8BUV1_9ASCO|nr:uncharacterized protein SAPINGB_P004513 [Saprochaete ingens]VVT55272.1 unnamed protein product [Saprochaete ingens]
MTKDSERSHVHLALPRSILFFEEWMKLPLEYDDIFVPPELQPPNPDDDHELNADYPLLSFGIPKPSAASARDKLMAWKELALGELLTNGPSHMLNAEDAVEFPDFTESLRQALDDMPAALVSPPQPTKFASTTMGMATASSNHKKNSLSPFQQQTQTQSQTQQQQQSQSQTQTQTQTQQHHHHHSASPGTPPHSSDFFISPSSSHHLVTRGPRRSSGNSSILSHRAHSHADPSHSPSIAGTSVSSDVRTPKTPAPGSATSSRLLNERRESRLGSSLSGRRRRNVPR